MKRRMGFVSNSSSASFMIPLIWITNTQADQLLAYGADQERNMDGWSINIDRQGERPRLWGFTVMDNDALSKFMKAIGIPDDAVFWEGDG
ncbi:MAG: hypothetical protein ABFE07_28795 [Armatimonadia bacterium]